MQKRMQHIVQYARQGCKPGSVKNGHLSRLYVAAQLKPPPENGRAGLLFFHGVAPDRVYIVPMLPWGWVSSYLTFPPLPVKPAVSLCCTFPGIAPGGRYPLSLPCGARTFLTYKPLGKHARPFTLLARIFYDKTAVASRC